MLQQFKVASLFGTFTKFSLILLFLTGCDQGFRAIRHTDQDFIPYIEMFEDYYGYEINVPIYYNELTGNWIGVCKTWSGGFREIQIDPMAWDYITESQRINLIFHELGHCVLGRSHDTLRLGDGCPASFMNEYNISNSCLDKHMDDYLEEMF